MKSDMKINRHNYQAYILDYYEGNLSEEQAAMLISFLERHPELKKEFDEYENIKLAGDQESITFKDKDLLKKQPVMEISRQQITDENYEEFFSAYMDGELSATAEADLLSYIKENSQLASEFQKWQKIKLEPDGSVVFPNKSSLKKYQFGVVRKLWYGVSAAAVVLIIGSLFFINDLIPDRQVQYVDDKAIKDIHLKTDISKDIFDPAESKPLTAEHQPAEPVKTDKPSSTTHQEDEPATIDIKPLNAGLLASMAAPQILNKVDQPDVIRREKRHAMPVRVIPEDHYDDPLTIPQFALAELEKRSGVNVRSLAPGNISVWDLAGTGLAAISNITGNPLTVNKERNEKGNITLLAIGDNFVISRGKTPVGDE